MTENPPADGARVFLLLSEEALMAQCEVDVYRASGPGGQKRNKISSAVRLRHTPTGLSAQAVEDRSQHSNKRRAVRRLRETLALMLRGTVALDTFRRSALMEGYVNDRGQLRINPRNPDFPLVVAEVLDVFAACGTRVGESAALLGLSTGHFVRFLESDTKVWRQANEMRRGAGEKPLR